MRHPQIAAGPLVASLFTQLLVPAGSGGTGSMVFAGLGGLLTTLVMAFAFALAISGADDAWRRNKAPLADAWRETTRRSGDVLFAAMGFGFVIYIAALAGGLLAPVTAGISALALPAVAVFFMIYALPAATIGGVPGQASLQISIDRAKANVLPTLAICALFVFAYVFVPAIVVGYLDRPLAMALGANAGIVSDVLLVAVQALCLTYVAIVLAKTYADLSYGRRW